MKIFFAVLMLLSSSSYALFVGKLIALEVGPSYGDKVYIDVVGTPENRPTCATSGNGYDFAFDGSTKLGDKMFSILLAAQKSNTSVKISGAGTCDVGGSVEDIKWIQSK
jgi:hypothetical protein